MLEPSTSHIGQGVALHAQAAVLVYMNVRHPQIAEMITHLFRNIYALMEEPSGSSMVNS
jgi:hypothetical protein